MSTVSRVLGIARAELGYQEGWSNGRWNNRNKFGAQYGANQQPWCAWFVRWVLERAQVPADSIPESGSCTINMNWAKKVGRWRAGTMGIQPGDVVIFNARPGGTPVHTGILESATATTVTTIDGNTNSSGSAEGNAVLRKTRPNNRVIGYIRPDYAAGGTMPGIKTVEDGRGALFELGPMQIPRGEWVTVARFRLPNPKRSYRPYTQLHVSLKQTTGGRPNYTQIRWAREGWGDAKPGELDTTSTKDNAVPSELADSYQDMHNTEIDGGGVLAAQVYVSGSGKAFVPVLIAKVK